MFRCNFCNKLFKGSPANCPVCGKPGVSWEPKEHLDMSIPRDRIWDAIQRVLYHKIHFDE